MKPWLSEQQSTTWSVRKRKQYLTHGMMLLDARHCKFQYSERGILSPQLAREQVEG